MEQNHPRRPAWRRWFDRYLIDAMSYMALGLFSSLIIGLIISQLSMIPFLAFLAPFASVIDASSPVVGGAIGAALLASAHTGSVTAAYAEEHIHYF